MHKHQYNPWEDKKTFVQNVGNAQSILDIIQSEGLNTSPSMPNFSNPENNQNNPNYKE